MDKWYKHLKKKTVRRMPKKNFLVLVGDFTAKIGIRNIWQLGNLGLEML